MVDIEMVTVHLAIITSLYDKCINDKIIQMIPTLVLARVLAMY